MISSRKSVICSNLLQKEMQYMSYAVFNSMDGDGERDFLHHSESVTENKQLLFEHLVKSELANRSHGALLPSVHTIITSPNIINDDKKSIMFDNYEEAKSENFSLNKKDTSKEKDDEVGSRKLEADCEVCGDEAVPHKHYGGVCCYSCKVKYFNCQS